VIYVSNSRNVEVTKFLQFLRVIMATGSDAVNLSNDALIFRNNVKLAP
jgi:polysaccharide export outer membrane protein